MAKNKYDFWGWATRNDLKCSDGRTIRHNAFKDCDGMTVPLVWNHQHNDPDNVLGHALLQNTDYGVKAYGFFNDAPKSQNVKTILQHGDITSLSIYANGLKQTQNGDVLHGIIREVSLVLAGANPGASIEYVMAHSADEDPVAIGAEIYSGEDLVLEHANVVDGIEIVDEPENEEEEVKSEEVVEEEPAEEVAEEKTEEASEEAKPEEELAHADSETKPEEIEKGKEEMAEKEDMTVQDVLDSMTPEQRKVCEYLVGEALSANDNEEGDEEDMKHNAFDNEEKVDNRIDDEIFEALSDGKRFGSVKESIIQHGLNPEEVLVSDNTLSHSITNIDYLFPEYKSIRNDVPFININPNGWVSVVNSGVHHTPFAKVKMAFADITEATARAKGYTKGTKKSDEVFKLLKRVVNPTTVYKKQSIDRDDLVDITDLDTIAWIKKEMRVKLDEELARAYLFGDGRTGSDPDKIDEDNIIPVVNDTENNLYAMVYTVSPAEGEAEAHAAIDTLIKAFDDYEGSGNVTAFVKASLVSDMMLLEDKIGQKLYKTLNELASTIGVDRIVKVPASVMPNDVYAVALDLKDYNVGANRGGEIALFDDFDIDYNKQKYLIETRCSGALTLPHSAIVLKTEGSSSL